MLEEQQENTQTGKMEALVFECVVSGGAAGVTRAHTHTEHTLLSLRRGKEATSWPQP